MGRASWRVFVTEVSQHGDFSSERIGVSVVTVEVFTYPLTEVYVLLVLGPWIASRSAALPQARRHTHWLRSGWG